MYVFNGGTQYNVNGVLTNYGASYAACMLAALKTVFAINAPLTFKELNFISLENKLKDSVMEDLLTYGVAPVNYNSNNIPYLVRQINTYQTDDLKWNEFSMVSIMYFVSRDLRNYLEGLFVGKAATTFSLAVLRTIITNRLEFYTDLGLFISDGDKSYWGVSVTLNGDTVTVDYDAYPTPPVNFIFITNHFHEVVAEAA